MRARKRTAAPTTSLRRRRSCVPPQALLYEGGQLARDDLLWVGTSGAYLMPPHGRSWLAGAVRRCQVADGSFPCVTAHDLRHTAASLAIHAGANVKVVQRMLGHASAAMTLDVYGGLFDADLDAVAENVGEMWARRG
jgi:integrase